MRIALMATAPTAAMIGYAGAQQPQWTDQLVASAPAPRSHAVRGVSVPARAPEARPQAVEASYYGDEFAGRPTANGDIFNPDMMTAAHRTLPFGSLVKVTDAISGKSAVVEINDRGPFHGNREIDLSTAAAREIGMLASGTAKVTLDVLRYA